MSPRKITRIFGILAVVLFYRSIHSELQIGFYKDTCSLVEFIIKQEVRKALVKDGVAAGLMGMHFHDCFVRGCDALILLDSTPSSTSEKDSFARVYEGVIIIDNAKVRLEAVCKGVVSCDDIVAFAARDSIEIVSTHTLLWVDDL